MELHIDMRCSAADATTATLVPKVDGDLGSLSDELTNIVLTFANARDVSLVPGTNTQYEVIIRRK